jgi:hypothetical protein
MLHIPLPVGSNPYGGGGSGGGLDSKHLVPPSAAAAAAAADREPYVFDARVDSKLVATNVSERVIQLQRVMHHTDQVHAPSKKIRTSHADQSLVSGYLWMQKNAVRASQHLTAPNPKTGPHSTGAVFPRLALTSALLVACACAPVCLSARVFARVHVHRANGQGFGSSTVTVS